MKKKTYTKPVVQVVRLHAANQMLAGSSNGGPVTSVSNDEGFRFDNDGLDGDDDLR